ncbi:ribosomal prt S27 [Enterospora canceri]|uniref:Ribosomal prt S27 n=1 Tax=Enterospora canceri TaxID=1081671 RepID=A0A1Y1S6B0_9MICR|nr:ribosomal prt S27 [Enterospora canceri]
MAQLQIPRNETAVHKKRRVFRTANSYFMHVKCRNCEETTVCYSHSQTDVRCCMCASVLATATGGKAALVEGAAFKKVENTY